MASRTGVADTPYPAASAGADCTDPGASSPPTMRGPQGGEHLVAYGQPFGQPYRRGSLHRVVPLPPAGPRHRHPVGVMPLG